jgi:hypothetical protein
VDANSTGGQDSRRAVAPSDDDDDDDDDDTMAWGLTRCVTEKVPDISLWGKEGRCVRLTSLPPCLEIIGASDSSVPKDLSRSSYFARLPSRYGCFIHGKIMQFFRYGGRDDSVGIATRWGLDGPGIESRWGRGFPHPSRQALWPTKHPILWIRGLFPGG